MRTRAYEARMCLDERGLVLERVLLRVERGEAALVVVPHVLELPPRGRLALAHARPLAAELARSEELVHRRVQRAQRQQTHCATCACACACAAPTRRWRWQWRGRRRRSRRCSLRARRGRRTLPGAQRFGVRDAGFLSCSHRLRFGSCFCAALDLTDYKRRQVFLQVKQEDWMEFFELETSI